VTFDSDFFDISLMKGHPPKIIWLRTGNIKTDEIINLFDIHRDAISKFLIHKDHENVSCLEIG